MDPMGLEEKTPIPKRRDASWIYAALGCRWEVTWLFWDGVSPIASHSIRVGTCIVTSAWSKHQPVYGYASNPIDTKIIEIQVDVFFQKLELELKRRSIWKHHLQYIYLHIHFISCEYIPNPIKIYLHRHPFTTSIATSPYKSPEPPCQRPCRRTSHVAGLGGDPVRPIPWDDDWHIFTYILVGVLFDTKNA